MVSLAFLFTLNVQLQLLHVVTFSTPLSLPMACIIFCCVYPSKVSNVKKKNSENTGNSLFNDSIYFETCVSGELMTKCKHCIFASLIVDQKFTVRFLTQQKRMNEKHAVQKK